MKPILLLSALLVCCTALWAQVPKNVIYDTLLIERFENDPTNNMLDFPSGFDNQWVNFDQDGFNGLCVEDGGITPYSWYWERDFSTDLVDTNSCYTSCSYFDQFQIIAALSCANWLILPPITIPDSLCVLEWKSLSFEGPLFMDGYQVLVSTAGNDVTAHVFQDTLFSAASMIACPGFDNCGSLIPSDYTLTDGYIHANAYTNPDYFFFYAFPEYNTYRGRLEPHAVSLAAYAGQTIYIAFLHDSNNDNLLQLDDILIVDKKASGVNNGWDIARHFTVSPNPATDFSRLQWSLHQPAEAVLEVRNWKSQLMVHTTIPAAAQQQFELNTTHWPKGIYLATVHTAQGTVTRRFAKI